MKRWLFFGVMGAIALVVVVRILTVVTWVGSKRLLVEVVVVDTQVPCPLANVRVTAFHAPRELREGDISRLDPTVFFPPAERADAVSRLTDQDGRCSFEYKFWAAGKNQWWWKNTGYVDTGRVWLQVAARDRPPTIVQLDRQSIKPRDIRDETALVLTVVLNKDVEPAEREH